jgi:hypothetical protein
MYFPNCLGKDFQAPSEDNMTDKIKYGRASRRTGVFLLIMGSLVGWVSFLLIDLPQLKPPGAVGEVVFASGLFTIPMLVVGAFLYWRSRQYDAPVGERVISDSKPNVLYLRSFAADLSIIGYAISALGMMKVTSGWKTEEEQLGEVLQPFGDLVAIGKPGETLPTPGAARLYASDADWKKVVTDQMQSARLVVIRAGTSAGLLWEFKEVVQVVNPKKLLIIILNMRKKDYEAFRKEANQICIKIIN